MPYFLIFMNTPLENILQNNEIKCNFIPEMFHLCFTHFKTFRYGFSKNSTKCSQKER